MSTTNDISRILSCGLCKNVCVSPLSTKCCRKTYCEECITKYVDKFKKCPLDGKKLRRAGLRQVPECLLQLMHLKITSEDNKETETPKERRRKLNLDMVVVIDSARKHIDHFVIETISEKLPLVMVRYFIHICKEAIKRNNTYFQIHTNLKVREIFEKSSPEIWVFTREDGEPFPNSNDFFRIRFDKLIIKFFDKTDKYLNLEKNLKNKLK